MDPTRGCPEALVEHARASPTGTQEPVEPRDASTVVLLRRGRAPGGLEVYLLRRDLGDGVRRRLLRLPRRRRRPPGLRRARSAGPGRPPQEWARRCSAPRRARARPGLRRGARDLRGVRRAARRARPRTPSSATPPATTGRRTGAASRRASSPSPTSSSGRGLVLRTDLLALVGVVGHAGLRAAALRHPLLRRRAARGPGHPRRLDRVRRGACGCRSATPSRPSTSGRLAMLPPTYATCLELYDLADPGRGAGAAASRDRSPILPRCRSTTTAATSHLPHRLVALGRVGGGAASRAHAVSLGRRGASATRGDCVLAPNPGIMTLDGTNTWVLRAARRRPSLVVDPGPLDEAHLAAGGGGGRRRRAGPAHPRAPRPRRGGAGLRGARRLRRARARPAAPARRRGARRRRRRGGRRPRGPGRRRRRATPADSLSFLLPADGAVLTGDTVLGRGTTVVAHPDGQLGAYLDSLHRLHALAEAQEVAARLARARPGGRRRAAAPRTSTSPTGATGSSRSREALRELGAGRARHARSSSTCTPTWTRSCGGRPSCRCGPSWSYLRRG